MTYPRKLILTVFSALFLSLALPTAMAVASPTAQRAPVATVVAGAGPAAAAQQSTDREVERYAERERQSSQLERFEGGRTVVVIGSLGALLLGALLVLLLI